jgi:D-aminoacyl-tRNA deacylase
MRVVLQRVSEASVAVGGEEVARIGRGFVLLVGAGRDDLEGEPERLADKIVHLRVFPDDEGRMNVALGDVGGEILVVSQFTLYGDVRRGRRPSWTAAAEPDVAAERVEALARALESRGVAVGRGVFGAHMEVELRNDGPVTLVLDGAELPG